MPVKGSGDGKESDMSWNMGSKLPKKVKMLELVARDGLQHEPKFMPTEAKAWFIDQFIQAGYDVVEVTNFSHPKLLPQHKDAEDVLKAVYRNPKVQKGGVHLKCYGMNVKAFERAADTKQKGYGPQSVAFTISAADKHGKRNANRTRQEFFQEIPEMARIAKSNGFDIDMAIACVYGCPIEGRVPIANTVELIDRGLDMGIRRFTPCDTTGESNPLRTYEYMSTLVDKFGKYQDITFKIAHFHDARGMGLANYLACILAGAEIVETSLGQLGGQPAFIVDGVPGIGTGPLYTDSDICGNGATEDVLVMLDEMGIQVGVDIDRVLQLGRVLERVLGRSLRPYCTKSGRVIKGPVNWNDYSRSDYGEFRHIPPFGEDYWAYPKA
ncbi:MAG: pyruvate carboxyltransferase [Chloroflexi bacterium]|nr:pyruvate carboxyltransferase [Chloroflexota bacterium]